MRFTSVRRGLPRLAGLLQSGGVPRIFTFGSSLTHQAHYLAPLPPALGTRAGQFYFTRVGLWGHTSEMAAPYTRREVLPFNPDCVFVEFSVMDRPTNVVEPDASATTTQRAIEGIVRTILSDDPGRDIAFIYHSGGERMMENDGPALAAHERVASHYGIPSIDLGAYAHAATIMGDAVWLQEETPRGAVPLTTDRLHHTSQGGQYIGAFFAQIVLELVAASDPAKRLQELPAPLTPDHLGDACALAPSAFLGEGWTISPLSGCREVGLPFDQLAVGAPGAGFALEYEGEGGSLWVMLRGGRLAGTHDGEAIAFDIDGTPDDGRARSLPLRAAARGVHRLELHVEGAPVTILGLNLRGPVLAARSS